MNAILRELWSSACPLVYPKENPDMKTLVDSLRRQNDMLRNEVEQMAIAVDQMGVVINQQQEQLKKLGFVEDEQPIDIIEPDEPEGKPDGNEPDTVLQ